jgi:hypothetical protein
MRTKWQAGQRRVERRDEEILEEQLASAAAGPTTADEDEKLVSLLNE